MTALLLGLLALILSSPAPTLLARVTALRGVPRASMVLWQSVALAAVLSAGGASLAVVTNSDLTRHPEVWRCLSAGFALTVALVVGIRLLLTAHRVGSGLRSMRRRHRELVDLLGAPDAGVHVLHHESPMAYCLPGLRSRVVVSDATLAVLSPIELQAVLWHERAHLKARHDLVLEAFTVLATAFPRWVSSAAALQEVTLLVEVLADRAAVRRVGATPLARALVSLAGQASPIASLGAANSGVVIRVRLMADKSSHRLLSAAAFATAVAVLALPTLVLVLPWLRS